MKKTHTTPVADSVPFDNDTNGFTADSTQEAIEEAKAQAEGFPRAGIPLVQNGVQGNGDWISYSNLVPDAVITFPVNSRINEITVANRKNSVEFDLEVYKNGSTAGDIVDTWSFSTGAGVNYASLSSVNLDLVVGDFIRLKYIDQGTNTSDLVVVIYFSRIS